jgi:signal peptide peptidase SppA
MNHSLIVAEFLSTPWALMPDRLTAIAQVVARWSANIPASPEVLASVRADAQAVEARRADTTQRAGGGAVAVLPFYGVCVQRTSAVDDVSGSGLMSMQRFSAGFRAALADDSVGAIVIDMDSPGGSVFGVQELGNEIFNARGQKRVVTVANSLAASAAYWIGSQASEFYITPGGEAGSIGVFAAHSDYSQALQKEGVNTTLVSAGKYKVEGNPYGPLSDEARAHMQGRIDTYYGAFTRAVARGRNVDVATVRDNMGQGRVFGAQDAKAANMVDGLMTLDDVIRQTARAVGGKGKSRAAAMAREISILNA